MNSRTALVIRAARAPILLITIGVLFALHQADVLNFSRTWPLLIIVIGVMTLLERTAAPKVWRAPQPTPPYTNYPGQYPPQPPPPPGVGDLR